MCAIYLSIFWTIWSQECGEKCCQFNGFSGFPVHCCSIPSNGVPCLHYKQWKWMIVSYQWNGFSIMKASYFTIYHIIYIWYYIYLWYYIYMILYICYIYDIIYMYILYYIFKYIYIYIIYMILYVYMIIYIYMIIYMIIYIDIIYILYIYISYVIPIHHIRWMIWSPINGDSWSPCLLNCRSRWSGTRMTKSQTLRSETVQLWPWLPVTLW